MADWGWIIVIAIWAVALYGFVTMKPPTTDRLTALSGSGIDAFYQEVPVQDGDRHQERN